MQKGVSECAFSKGKKQRTRKGVDKEPQKRPYIQKDSTVNATDSLTESDSVRHTAKCVPFSISFNPMHCYTMPIVNSHAHLQILRGLVYSNLLLWRLPYTAPAACNES